MIDALNRYLEFDKYMFVLEYKGMIKNDYKYSFARGVKNNDGSTGYDMMDIMVSELTDIDKIIAEPEKWWDFLDRKRKCETCWRILIKIFYDVTLLPQCYFEEITRPNTTDKIIDKYGWNDYRSNNYNFSHDTMEPIYELNLWFKHGETIGDKLDHVKTLISEYENSLTKENFDE